MSTPCKIVVILGVTASGKTDLGTKLAKKFSGEVVSADSRQVYKEFTIGTAKPPGHWLRLGGEQTYLAEGISHYLVDVVDPKEEFTLADYKALALERINSIIKKGRLPFLVGGTALYLKTITENWDIPKVKPDLAWRARLQNKRAEDLFRQLQRADPEAAAITGPKNKRRIIRALEVIQATGQKFSRQRRAGPRLFNALKIGLKIEKRDLQHNIEMRTKKMFQAGLLSEVARLHKKYSWSLVSMQSIGYQEFKDYFERQKTLEETIKIINQHHLAYAKRQMTWFKKDKTIYWVSSDPQLAFIEAIKLTQNFIS